MKFSLSTMEPYHYNCEYAIVEYNAGESIELPLMVQESKDWGSVLAGKCTDGDVNSISNIELGWTTLDDQQNHFYSLKENKNDIIILTDKLSQIGKIEELVIGIAPGGHVSIWCKKNNERILLLSSLAFFKKGCLNIGIEVKARVGRFLYKPIVIFSNNIFDYCLKGVKIMGFDGSILIYDSLSNSYRMNGIPRKIAIRWNVSKTNYEIFGWFDFDATYYLFSKFYYAHPETKTDFIIRIDAENKKYELALYRQGLKEPVVIPESAYQLIVFKNKFEDYRSENYNQPRGAWIW